MCACMFNPIMSYPNKILRWLPNLKIVKKFDEIYNLESQYAVVSQPLTEWEEVKLLAGRNFRECQLSISR